MPNYCREPVCGKAVCAAVCFEECGKTSSLKQPTGSQSISAMAVPRDHASAHHAGPGVDVWRCQAESYLTKTNLHGPV